MVKRNLCKKKFMKNCDFSPHLMKNFAKIALQNKTMSKIFATSDCGHDKI